MDGILDQTWTMKRTKNKQIKRKITWSKPKKRKSNT